MYTKYLQLNSNKAAEGGGFYVSSSKATRIMRCEVFRVSVSPRIIVLIVIVIRLRSQF